VNINTTDQYGGSAYLIAAQNGHVGCMQILEQNGADKEIKTKVGSTAIHEGVLSKRKNVVEYLISKRFPVNIKRGDGYTPLALAIMNSKDLTIPKLLLEGGADPNLVSKEGVSPLFFAIKTKNLEAIQLLLDY
jgi:ankyrin repeat protein